MRFAIETWAPEYGAATDPELPETGATVDAEIERDLDGWAPITPPSLGEAPKRILFTDGVRRVDAQV